MNKKWVRFLCEMSQKWVRFSCETPLYYHLDNFNLLFLGIDHSLHRGDPVCFFNFFPTKRMSVDSTRHKVYTYRDNWECYTNTVNFDQVQSRMWSFFPEGLTIFVLFFFVIFYYSTPVVDDAFYYKVFITWRYKIWIQIGTIRRPIRVDHTNFFKCLLKLIHSRGNLQIRLVLLLFSFQRPVEWFQVSQ